MKIACLGWGSLIWKSGALPVASPWHCDGPRVPIEFVRISEGGELATAICLNATPVPVLWAWLNTASLETACRALREREGIPDSREDGLGILTVTDTSAGPLADWARARGIEGLIWTALPACMAGVEGRIPALDEAVAYLQRLEGDTREHARRYIEQVPAQIDTAYRRAFAALPGWQRIIPD
ncbi:MULTISPECIES: hypothetical protein [Pantoea]|jgi:hypothetical protein|uniref:Uncharacterized protein n=1 Tax=Pantoea brenneri TaxID=472694 RepID=A0A653VRP6_9GAMM|nr:MULTISPECIES: hypothetical protein [Pantoea]KKD34037.1 hypothetical protein EP46_09225 [Pantoea sp. 3.5.1]MBS6032518.1 hypothetical protein [Pantoea sp.]MBZ6393799.1 hypothetical protein [Pantoea sp.]MBZ6436823.1 hypothetical protein [Pantoea sp.]MCQ5472411.1 hypothetical protein [Pantoea brenneri]